MKVSTPNILMSVVVLALAACSSAETQKHKRHAVRPAPASVVDETSKVEPASGGCVSCGVVSGVVDNKAAADATPDTKNARTQ